MTTNVAKDKRGFAHRAQRFEIEIPIRYREAGTVAWLEGKTVNISKSGILFHAQQILRPHTVLDVALALPAAISGEEPAEIGCRGIVVREARTSGQNGLPILAASIRGFRFVHKRRNPSQRGLKRATS